MKKFIALFLALCFCFSATTTAFAAEADAVQSDSQLICATADENVEVVYADNEKALIAYTVQPRENNYGYAWLNSSASSSFTVYTNYSGRLGFTFKVECSDSSAFAYLSVQKPGGGYYWNSLTVGVTNGEVKKSVTGASSGTYTIHYNAYAPAGTRIMCWIYQN